MIKIFNVLDKNKVSLIRNTSICALSLIAVLTTLPGCKSNKESAYVFDGVQDATVDEESDIYTITMSDGDVYNISKEEIDSTYDFEYDPYVEESWEPRELKDTDNYLDNISDISSESQMESAIKDNDMVLIKRVS